MKYTLYNGSVEIDFNPASHRYTLNKKSIPSVTSITGLIDKSAPLIIWAVNLTREYLINRLERSKVTLEDINEACKQHTQKKEKSASIGTIFHEILKDYPSSLTSIELSEEDRARVNKVVMWIEDNKISFQETERVIYSKKHKFSGILDAVVMIKGKRYIIDYKTSNNIYPEYHLQISAYVKAYVEETRKTIDGALLVHVTTENIEVTTISRKDIQKNYKAFLGLLLTKNRIKEITKG